MNIFNLLILFVFIHFLVIYVISSIFIPNLGWKRRINEKLPYAVKQDMKKIGSSYKKKEEVLKAVIDYMLVKKGFYGKYFQVFKKFLYLFESSFNKLWKKGGFLHCHQHNLVLRYLLLGTERFSEKDISLKITNCFLNIHQYLKIDISDEVMKKRFVNIDPFAISVGCKYGDVLPKFRFIKKLRQKSKN